MLKEYYSDILDEFSKHLEKRKKLLKDNCIAIAVNDAVDSIELSNFETGVKTIEEVGFQNNKLT